LIVGVVTLFIWLNYLEKQIWKGQYRNYWTLVIVTTSVFFFFSKGLNIPPMVSMSCGAFIALGILLPYFQGRLNNCFDFDTVPKIDQILFHNMRKNR
jgi:hypothetical protein